MARAGQLVHAWALVYSAYKLAAQVSINSSGSKSVCSLETNDGLYRELLKDGVLVIEGDAKRHDVQLTAGVHRAKGICIVIDNHADNLYITVTARSMNANLKIITRAGRQRYDQAIRSSGADEVIIPEYEGGLMTGRMIERYYPVHSKLA